MSNHNEFTNKSICGRIYIALYDPKTLRISTGDSWEKNAIGNLSLHNFNNSIAIA